MTQAIHNNISQAMKHWQQANKTNPPCPIHTQLAIAHYTDAQAAIERRIDTLTERLNENK